MIASPHGGVNIEEIARTNPSAILKEPVDIMDGEITAIYLATCGTCV